ncbi:hypothetical protein QN277_009559 [Acacia crassicarpa]|uniref:RNase H type-1 domain-containing protein n=1 Tax=Acacia crassicarpa TaxID=499986 RepID=A0AAE1INC9_9FABA|nr:hypothetical protein QN277_009559 [Acacia crassicarpa]
MNHRNPLTTYDCALIGWLLWFIWKGRNDYVFSKVRLDPSMVIEKAQQALINYWTVWFPDNDRAVSNTPTPAVKWVPPAEHVLKVNVDGSFKASTAFAAIGLVCRDHWGHMQWAFVDKVKSISAFMTKALALKRALMILQDLGNKNVLLESDNQTLVHCVENNQPSLCEWQARGIIDDITSVLKSESSFSVIYTPRQGNKAADWLAAATNKEVCPIGWVGIPLPPLSQMLDNDMKATRSQ